MRQEGASYDTVDNLPFPRSREPKANFICPNNPEGRLGSLFSPVSHCNQPAALRGAKLCTGDGSRHGPTGPCRDTGNNRYSPRSVESMSRGNPIQKTIEEGGGGNFT